jgi:HNH endonuclease
VQPPLRMGRMMSELQTRKHWPIEVVGDCHVWQGAMLRNGYGTVTVDGRTWLAHRYAYTTQRGPIPDGLHIDHLCRNRACVNPDHLEPVTQAENNRRAADAQTHCRNGHPRTEDNLIVDSDGQRRCRTCRSADRREAQRRYRAKRRAA